jgi:hypothetical protein
MMAKKPHHAPHRLRGRQRTGAAAGQGRGVGAPTAPASLDAPALGAGYAERASNDLHFSRVRQLVPLAAVLSRYGILPALKRSGPQLKGCCPIHDGSNPQQFVVNADESTWHCFGDCHAGGGTLEFVAAIEGVPIARAATLIAHWFALADTGEALPEARKQRRKTMQERPSHKAFVVENREGDDEQQGGFWTRIGAAWPHKDGKGLNLVLSALPVGGRIVLREYTAEDEEREQKRASQQRM